MPPAPPTADDHGDLPAVPADGRAGGDRPPVLPTALRVPARSRLDPARHDHDAIVERHERALDAGDPGYLDPSTGLFVMTAAYLWARGTCCDTGCRHCPYVRPR